MTKKHLHQFLLFRLYVLLFRLYVLLFVDQQLNYDLDRYLAVWEIVLVILDYQLCWLFSPSWRIYSFSYTVFDMGHYMSDVWTSLLDHSRVPSLPLSSKALNPLPSRTSRFIPCFSTTGSTKNYVFNPLVFGSEAFLEWNLEFCLSEISDSIILWL